MSAARGIKPEPEYGYGQYNYTCTCPLCDWFAQDDKGMSRPERAYHRHWFSVHTGFRRTFVDPGTA